MVVDGGGVSGASMMYTLALAICGLFNQLSTRLFS